MNTKVRISRGTNNNEFSRVQVWSRENIGYAGPPGKLIQGLFECFIVKMDLVRDVLSMNPVGFVIQ